MLSLLCESACQCPTYNSCSTERDQSPLDCLETVAGVIQVGTQWFLFSVMCVLPRATSPYRLTGPPSLVLYMLYFPPHLKYVTLDIDADELGPSERIKTDLKSDTWRLSITLLWIVVIHLSVFHRFQASH